MFGWHTSYHRHTSLPTSPSPTHTLLASSLLSHVPPPTYLLELFSHKVSLCYLPQDPGSVVLVGREGAELSDSFHKIILTESSVS